MKDLVDVRDDFSMSCAIQRLAIDLKDLIANLQIRLVCRGSYRKEKFQSYKNETKRPKIYWQVHELIALTHFLVSFQRQQTHRIGSVYQLLFEY